MNTYPPESYEGRKDIDMKVRELMRHSHLIQGQKTKLNDYSTAKTFITVDRYCFDIDSNEVERLLNLKVNSFDVSEFGLTIHAE